MLPGVPKVCLLSTGEYLVRNIVIGGLVFEQKRLLTNHKKLILSIFALTKLEEIYCESVVSPGELL